jgi:chitin disaccharide deacetylase
MADPYLPRPLIIRGDDAGLDVQANAAIERCARAGLMQNVSVMVPGPAFADAARRLRDLPQVAVGLHVTLNCEWATVGFGPTLPTDRVPQLVREDGRFYPEPGHLHERQVDVAQVVDEVGHQLALARQAGLRVVYLDEHMGVGWVRDLRPALQDLSRRNHLIYAEGVTSHPIDSSIIRRLIEGEGLPEPVVSSSPLPCRWITHPMDPVDVDHWRLESVPEEDIITARLDEAQLLTRPRLAFALESAGLVPVRYDQIT